MGALIATHRQSDIAWQPSTQQHANATWHDTARRHDGMAAQQHNSTTHNDGTTPQPAHDMHDSTIHSDGTTPQLPDSRPQHDTARRHDSTAAVQRDGTTAQQHYILTHTTSTTA